MRCNGGTMMYGEKKPTQKREVTGVTEGLAIWKETPHEKKSVGKENL